MYETTKEHREPTPQLLFLSQSPCTKDRIGALPISFYLRAPRLSAFPVTCRCALRYECVMPRAECQGTLFLPVRVHYISIEKNSARFALLGWFLAWLCLPLLFSPHQPARSPNAARLLWFLYTERGNAYYATEVDVIANQRLACSEVIDI